MPLTDAACRNASCPPDRARLRLTDGGGLYLEIAPNQSRRWFWKHHGSRANTTNDLLRLIDSRHFIFSTNNTYFGHPNAEAVARVIVDGNKPTLWFNYDTPQNRHWASAELTAAYGHSVCFPERPEVGVKLELATRLTR